ncbi:MAG TPA: AMP-binding protein, partial [Steroidobacteraceae bacterium]|nr:AMP-binding protein [Steroidobacteraceae bacterium]
RIAVLMCNSVDMVEIMFAALKAGAAVVPLNTSVTDAAAAAMIEDSGAVAVAASDEHCARVDALRPALGRVRHYLAPENLAGWTTLESLRAGGPDEAPLVEVADDDVCNIIYSSGTTGLPKGIVHTHRRRLDWAYDLAIALRYHSGAVTLCTLGLYSNISWVGLLCTFLAGGTVVVARGFDAGEVLKVIARRRVTHTSMVPVQFQRLLEHPQLAASDVSSLQAVMCCGSPLALETKRALIGRLGCDFIELYGLTEGVITTLAPEDAHRKLASVGKPLHGTDLRIIDEAGREAARGEAGEIVSRGRIVMAGYHGRPDANAESTWLDERGRAWLRTGDIGRLDEEGFLYIVDRRKDMIISGGQNVYPADIEAVMIAHADVSEVAVIGVASEKWGESPFGIVVLRPGARGDGAALVKWTNERVGRQQRIVGVAFRDSLPRNPNGKILKRELRREYPGTG